MLVFGWRRLYEFGRWDEKKTKKAELRLGQEQIEAAEKQQRENAKLKRYIKNRKAPELLKECFQKIKEEADAGKQKAKISVGSYNQGTDEIALFYLAEVVTDLLKKKKFKVTTNFYNYDGVALEGFDPGTAVYLNVEW